jgi:hypothetical protein
MQLPPVAAPVNAKVDGGDEFSITTSGNDHSKPAQDAVEMNYVPKKVKAAR